MTDVGVTPRSQTPQPGCASAAFRPATPADVPLLRQLVLAGIRHWAHDVEHPAAFAGLEAEGLPTEDSVARHTVELLAEPGRTFGFFSLADRGDGDVELVHMFVVVDLIRTGVGRRLWQRAIELAAARGRRLKIMSDPRAIGFYAAMGATLTQRVEFVPGFGLGEMWFDLDGEPGRRAGD